MFAILKQNLTFGLRTLAKSPGFAVTAVLTLALGIGATTAMFSVVYAVFEPMPYPKSDQLVMVWSKLPAGRNSVAAGDFFEWQKRSTSFAAMNAWSGDGFNVSGGDRPELVPARIALPASSRWKDSRCYSVADFTPEEAEPGKDHVVILSHRLWLRQYGGNRDLIGKPIPPERATLHRRRHSAPACTIGSTHSCGCRSHSGRKRSCMMRISCR
jgi:putative ABC transport system permease protein